MSNDIKLPSGESISDRRINTVEVQTAVLKLLAKVESMEGNIEVRLEAVKEKIENLDSKMSSRIESVEARLIDHCDDEKDINEVLGQHDKSIEKAKTYIERIHRLESKYEELDSKLTELEANPVKQKAKLITDFADTLKKAVYVAIAGGIVSFFMYTLLQFVGKK